MPPLPHMTPDPDRSALIGLMRPRVSLMAAGSAALGYVLYDPVLNPTLVPLALGVFLMAGGASGLNQFQERDIDALMLRTRNRPLPTGAMDPLTALYSALLLMAMGFMALLVVFGAGAANMGGLAVLLYNGAYTPLKRRVRWAVLPGAFVGAIPPVLGWTAAGGGLNGPGVWALAAFYYVWQVPHYWLILIEYREDYGRAGLPTVADLLTGAQMRRVASLWLVSSALVCVMGMAMMGGGTGALPGAGLILALWVIAGAARLAGDAGCGGFTSGRAVTYMMVASLSIWLDRVAGALIAR